VAEESNPANNQLAADATSTTQSQVAGDAPVNEKPDAAEETSHGGEPGEGHQAAAAKQGKDDQAAAAAAAAAANALPVADVKGQGGQAQEAGEGAVADAGQDGDDKAAAAAGEGGETKKKGTWWQDPPDNALVSKGGILVAGLFLLLLTIAILASITVLWPVCEIRPEEQSPNKNSNENANGNANANRNANANANTAGNANTNANRNGNANGNANTNVNTNTNANINANANAGGSATPALPPAPQQSPAQPPAPGATTARADLDSIEPKSGSIFGNTEVTIRGKNFASGDVVKFDGKPAQPGHFGAESITVRTPKHEEGAVDVTLQRGAEVQDTLAGQYTYICPAPTGTGLFMMLVLAGALGGCIHALRSLYWYTGQGTLKWRWLPMYFILPFTGAATAMIFSLLIVAGLVSNTTGRGESLFIIAIAGLVGMFSQQAALKLTDIANAFFTKPGEGKDSNPQKSISVGAGDQQGAPTDAFTISKNSGAAGDEVAIKGNGFSAETTVTFGAARANIKKFDANTLTTVVPAQPAGAPSEVDVEVKTGARSVKLTSKFKYT
jgi:hypothetical protein